ncbi:hypothetical protein J31TS3_51610 [Paenibacillus lactis]|nr:hypothetical protein J31TS3_51610 [Paenibacillus lactis]
MFNDIIGFGVHVDGRSHPCYNYLKLKIYELEIINRCRVVHTA